MLRIAGFPNKNSGLPRLRVASVLHNRGCQFSRRRQDAALFS
jgi:hypothetical protein